MMKNVTNNVHDRGITEINSSLCKCERENIDDGGGHWHGSVSHIIRNEPSSLLRSPLHLHRRNHGRHGTNEGEGELPWV